MKKSLVFTCTFLLFVGISQASFATPWGTVLSQNTTGVSDDHFTGAPEGGGNANFYGLGNTMVVFDLGLDRLVDGVGQDFNIYEDDYGSVEFHRIDVFASLDNSNWFNVDSTIAAGVRISGDDAHQGTSFFRSYNLAGSSLSEAKYIKIQGTYGSSSGQTAGFDLDAIGLINYTTNPIPEPATMLLFGTGLVGVVGAKFRKKKK